MWTTGDTTFDRLVKRLPGVEEGIIDYLESDFDIHYREVPEDAFTARYYAVVDRNMSYNDYELMWNDNLDDLLNDIMEEVVRENGEIHAIFDNGKRLNFEVKIVISEG